MQRYILAALLTVAFASVASAATPRHRFVVITGVDAEKGTITYTIVSGPDKDSEVKAPITKSCVLKEGYYRLGKPATLNEGDDIENGLKNAVFQKATAKNPLRVDIWTAEED